MCPACCRSMRTRQPRSCPGGPRKGGSAAFVGASTSEYPSRPLTRLSWSEDPLVVAAEVWPCYFTGWTAANEWALSDQVFRTTVLKTTSRVRASNVRLLDHDYLISSTNDADMRWGMKSQWRHESRLRFADPARTVVDILDAPRLGGGMRHGAEILAAYLDEHDPTTLLDYGDRLGNRALFKRLGYIIEAMGMDLPRILGACQERVSAGISALDPDGPPGGRSNTRWRTSSQRHRRRGGTRMISRRELDELGGEWSLDIGVIEKDYVLGWLLAGVAQHPICRNVGVQGWHLPPQVLLRDLPILGGSRLHCHRRGTRGSRRPPAHLWRDSRLDPRRIRHRARRRRAAHFGGARTAAATRRLRARSPTGGRTRRVERSPR